MTAVLVGERWRGLEPVRAVRCVQPCRTAVVCGTVCSGELQWDVTAAASGGAGRAWEEPAAAAAGDSTRSSPTIPCGRRSLQRRTGRSDGSAVMNPGLGDVPHPLSPDFGLQLQPYTTQVTALTINI